MSLRTNILKILREEDSNRVDLKVNKDNFKDGVKLSQDAMQQDSGIDGVNLELQEGDDDIQNEGMDNLQVPDDAEAYEDEYAEKEKLKQMVAKDQSVNEVVGRMSKGKLEALVEQNKKIATAYKKIIKVADIKRKNG